MKRRRREDKKTIQRGYQSNLRNLNNLSNLNNLKIS